MNTTRTAAAALRGSPSARHGLKLMLLCALALTTWGIARADATDLSNQPLATRPNVQAKPNLLFILDDSGSMANDYMPDDMSSGVSGNNSYEYYGYRSAQCNGVAYDPSITYSPPLFSDGTSYSNADFSAAKDDGFTTSGSATDLTNSYYYSYNGNNGVKQPKMGWTYTSSGVVSNTFSQECKTRTSSNSTLFSKVTMTAASSDAQNYANWYSYYRKRYLLMRTAMGRAISVLDSGYRVGFSTISDHSATDGTNKFRDVKDFDANQKSNFYSSLYSAAPGSNTPLRGALSKAGRYFANKVSGQSYDPIQYSCQRNYALLSTDGYWNTGTESTNSPRYGPYQLDNATKVGNQDGTEVRPMKDDTSNLVTTVVTYQKVATRTETDVSTSTSGWSWTSTTTASSTGGSGGSGKGRVSCRNTYLVTTISNAATETQTKTVTTPQKGVGAYTVTTVTTDGTVTSGPTTGSTTYSSWINQTSNTSTADTGTPVSSDYASTTSYSCSTTKGSGSAVITQPSQGAWSLWSTPIPSYSAVTLGSDYVAPTTTTTPSVLGGTSNTLADIAEYYYKTDLRSSANGNCTSTTSGENVCSDIVPAVDSDTATWQHLNTFTIGLGVSGTLAYDRNYLTQTAGSYVDLKNGTKNWPAPAETSSGGNATNVDDLWHAAVNGRGQYYSALNAGLLADAINGVINSVQKVSGSASAASTSALELVAGDNNYVFGASYTTVSWTGDLQAFTLDASDASIGTTPVWSAQAKLDSTTVANRQIYFKGSGGLQSFTYDNLSPQQKAYFDNMCSKALVPSQCSSLTSGDATVANSGTNLVNYLKGTKSYETPVATASNGVSATGSGLYRKREHLLGDIINGAPVYIAKPPFKYGDAGYADFVTSNTNRQAVVYVAANDGMLHAFSASDGTELWAYIPSAVMPNLYKLADASYSSRHQYFVDGAPVMGDIKVGNTWKTILVAGLNSGGSSYYALDITDPANPVALWEFTDSNMGLSFGNPVITKRADGTWVVAFTSGYNNTSGDGQGHLYVVNASTGAKLLDISTGAGSSATPSGLAKINAWIDNTSDNTAKRFYGGDLQGNLWRFDMDNLVAPNQSALQLAKFQLDAATPQPITTKPELALASNQPIVIAATGRYLGVTDIGDTTQESIYAVKDKLTGTGWGDLRANTSNFVKQTFTLDGNTASVTSLKVDWSTKGGWWVDLPHSGERVATNVSLQFNTLAVPTAIPTGDACSSGGSSWLYYLDVTNGGVVTTNPSGQLWSANSLIVGQSWVKDSNGNVRIITQGSSGEKRVDVPPVPPMTGGGSAHRTSWRELSD